MTREKRHCVIVLGMHRSGTSVVTRAISLLGAALPAHLLPASKFNKNGYWESKAVVDANSAILTDLDRSWLDFRQIDLQALTPTRRERYVRQATDCITAEFADAPRFVLKDPRLCRLIPIWRDALTGLEIEIDYVIVFRNPLAVAQSLVKRSGILFYRGCLLWLRYILEAERYTRGNKRLFLSYEALMQQPKEAVTRMAEIGQLDSENVDKATTAIDHNLWHNRSAAEAGAEDGELRQLLNEVHQGCFAFVDHPDSRSLQARFDEITNKLDSAVGFLGPFLAESERALMEKTQAREELKAQASKHAEKLAKTIAAQRDQIDKIRRRRDRQKRFAFRRLAKLNAVQASLSWRITAPLRWCERVLSGDRPK